MDVRVRRAVETDAQAIARDVFGNLPEDDVVDNFLGCLKDERVNIFVAEARERAAGPGGSFRIVGHMQVDLAGPPRTHVLRVYSMVVSEGWRQKGVGRRMMEFLDTWAREHDVEMMLLEVYPDNSPARKFYEGLGFEQYGFLGRGSKFDAGDYKDEVLMYRWIG